MKTIFLTTIPFLIVNFFYSIFVTALMIITFVNGASEWYIYLISIIAFLFVNISLILCFVLKIKVFNDKIIVYDIRKTEIKFDEVKQIYTKENEKHKFIYVETLDRKHVIPGKSTLLGEKGNAKANQKIVKIIIDYLNSNSKETLNN